MTMMLMLMLMVVVMVMVMVMVMVIAMVMVTVMVMVMVMVGVSCHPQRLIPGQWMGRMDLVRQERTPPMPPRIVVWRHPVTMAACHLTTEWTF